MARFPRSSGTLILLAAVMSLLAAPTDGASWVPIAGTPSAPASAGAPQGEGEPLQLRAAVHVHSVASTGDLPLEALAELALRQGLDALVLSENLVLRVRYAPWPLRYLFELRRGMPALIDFGVDNHLREVEAVQSRHPELLLLPGVEVDPFYYWTGTPWAGDLTLHDTQRNLLVVPPLPSDAGTDAEGRLSGAAAFLEGLPVIENPGGAGHGWGSLKELLPGLTLALIGLFGLRHRRPSRHGHLRRRGRPANRRPRGAGAGRFRRSGQFLRAVPLGRSLLLLVGLLLLLHRFPFTEPGFYPYDTAAGFTPHQSLIDYVEARGGLAFWSLPEAVDRQLIQVGPVPVRLSTEPYPEVLDATFGYVGFGGVYADTVTLLDPGGPWDRLLLAYNRGERQTPPWVIGESAFHFTGQAGKQLADVLTILYVSERTRGAVFDALRGGHSYATNRGDGVHIHLSELTLRLPGTAAAAGPGEELQVPAGERMELTVEVQAEGGERVPCRVRVIRQGVVHVTWDGTTPLRRTLVDSLRPEEGAVYYRVEVRGPRQQQIVSNPIFARQP